MRPTSRPRYSATTTALAFASCAETSATTAFFLSRSRPKVYLHLSKPLVERPAAPTATLHSGMTCLGFAICVGRRDAFLRLNLSVPTVFDNPPRAVQAARWPKVLLSLISAVRLQRRSSSLRPPALPDPLSRTPTLSADRCPSHWTASICSPRRPAPRGCRATALP